MQTLHQKGSGKFRWVKKKRADSTTPERPIFWDRVMAKRILPHSSRLPHYWRDTVLLSGSFYFRPSYASAPNLAIGAEIRFSKWSFFLVWFASNVSPLRYEPLFCLSFCVFSRRSGDMAMRGVYTLRKPLGLRLRIRQAALIRIRLSEKPNRIWQECQELQAA